MGSMMSPRPFHFSRLGSPKATLGTANGDTRLDVPVPLEHPLGSVYNFYTWSEELRDFAKEIIQAGPKGERILDVERSWKLGKIWERFNMPKLNNQMRLVYLTSSYVM